MKLPIALLRPPQRPPLWAAQLALALSCLPILLAACGQSTLPRTARSATVSGTPGNSPVAFVYTWFSSTGTAGLVGASAHGGSAVWRVEVGHANWAPIIVGDTVYACVVGHGYAGQNIVAVRVATGQLKWRTTLPADNFNYVINADTTAVVVDAGDNGLYALNPQNGAIRWHLPLFVERNPLIYAGVVYALVDAQRFSLPSLNAYRASDGKLLWSVPHPQGAHNGRIELNSSAIVENVSTVGPAAFSLRDGRLLWTGEGGFIVAATNAAVFIEDQNYHLDALSAQDGSSLWQTSISAGYDSIDYDVAPVANNVLYVTGSSGGIAAVRTRDGTVLWQHTNMNAEAVIVVNGVAYVYTSVPPYDSGGCGLGACTDQVVALNAATGALLWQKSVPDGQMLAEPVASDEVRGQ
jgi:outer membrane protein assembly factor BamB